MVNRRFSRGVRRFAVVVTPMLAGLLVASTAYCDDLFFGDPTAIRVFVGFLLEPSIIIAEAVAYYFALRISGWRALATSLVANLASLAVGWGVALSLATPDVVRNPNPPNLALRTVLGLLVTLGVELPIVVGMNRRYSDRARLLKVAAIANVCTYAIVRAIIVTWATLAARP